MSINKGAKDDANRALCFQWKASSRRIKLYRTWYLKKKVLFKKLDYARTSQWYHLNKMVAFFH